MTEGLATGRVPLLRAEELRREFRVGSRRGLTKSATIAVDGVSLHIREQETLALVGESGSGKSTTARMISGLLEPTAGAVLFRGKPLADLGKRERLAYRRAVQVVFQDPMASFNPRRTVRKALSLPIRLHDVVKPAQESEYISMLLDRVGLSPAGSYLNRLPQSLSGGQRQRLALARALSLRPRVIVADEPLSALDVSIQAQILELMLRLKQEESMGFLVITHDLAVVRLIADRVAVMYRGKIVESGDTRDIFERPQHPYTRSLLAATPKPDPTARHLGDIAAPDSAPPAPGGGCSFLSRCPSYELRCQEEPRLMELWVGHHAACHVASGNAGPNNELSVLADMEVGK